MALVSGPAAALLPAHAQTTALPAVTVVDTAETADGNEKTGYRSTTASRVGPLGAQSLQDTPFSINVMPEALITNIGATTPDDLFRLNPVTQLSSPQSRFFTGVNLRGFAVNSNKLVDGLPNANMVSVDLEDKERVEVLTGLSGFLYGAGNVGGTVNYVLKRPTYTRLNKVTLGYTGGENFYVHGDFGGPIDKDGKFAYRVNAVSRAGDNQMDYQSTRKSFGSAAFDWNITDRAVLQVDMSRSDYRMHGSEPYWSAAAGVQYPAAPDASRFYGQPFTYTDSQQDHLGARFKWDISDSQTLRVAVARRTSESNLIAANNTLANAAGNYTVRTSAWNYPSITNRAANLFFDQKFETGPLRHKLTLGYYGDDTEASNYRISSTGWLPLTGFNINNPTYAAQPNFGGFGPEYKASTGRNGNVIIADEIAFGEKWSALVGVNRARISNRSFNQAGAETSGYSAKDFTPTTALLFKPVPWITTYVSYMEGLEQGGTAAPAFNGVPVVNANTTMPPLASKQYEIGAKATVGGMLLTAAWFNIDKGLQYYDITNPSRPLYVQDGRQVHKGLEVTASGKVSRQWAFYGGLTAFDATVKRNKQSPALEGKTPDNVARTLIKGYAEYEVPSVPGLVLTGGAYYTGKQWADLNNTVELPGFTTFDVGARYATQVGASTLTLRLNVTNAGDRSYWLSSFYLGAPRTVVASAQLSF